MGGPSHSGPGPGEAEIDREEGSGSMSSWPQSLALRPNLLWSLAYWLSWEDRKSKLGSLS